MVTEVSRRAIQDQEVSAEGKRKLIAQQRYKRTFFRLASDRLSIPIGLRALKKYEDADFQLLLYSEPAKGENSMNLPASLKFLVAQVFRGFPVDDQTYEPKLRVSRLAFLYNRAAIHVEPTIETPKREGREDLFITFPDRTRAVSSRIEFNIDPGGDYIVESGNPNGRSEWIHSSTRPPRPYKARRYQLTPENIGDFADLARTISASPHSNLTLHKVH